MATLNTLFPAASHRIKRTLAVGALALGGVLASSVPALAADQPSAGGSRPAVQPSAALDTVSAAVGPTAKIPADKVPITDEIAAIPKEIAEQLEMYGSAGAWSDLERLLDLAQEGELKNPGADLGGSKDARFDWQAVTGHSDTRPADRIQRGDQSLFDLVKDRAGAPSRGDGTGRHGDGGALVPDRSKDESQVATPTGPPAAGDVLPDTRSLFAAKYGGSCGPGCAWRAGRYSDGTRRITSVQRVAPRKGERARWAVTDTWFHPDGSVTRYETVRNENGTLGGGKKYHWAPEDYSFGDERRYGDYTTEQILRKLGEPVQDGGPKKQSNADSQPNPEDTNGGLSDNCNWNPIYAQCLNDTTSREQKISQPGPQGQLEVPAEAAVGASIQERKDVVTQPNPAAEPSGGGGGTPQTGPRGGGPCTVC